MGRKRRIPQASSLPSYIILPHSMGSQVLRMLLWKCCTQYASKSGKLSSGHRSLEKVSFHSSLKGGQYQRMFKLQHNCTHLMLKILKAMLQQYVIYGLPDVHGGFRKGRRTRDQIANICWIMEKARELQKYINFCFVDYTKAFDCVDHNKLENSLRDGNTRPLCLPLEKSVCRSRSNS